MLPLYTEQEFNDSKSTSLLTCKCYQCGQPFMIQKKLITHELKHRRGRVKYCSQKCHCIVNHPWLREEKSCTTCGKLFIRKAREIKRSKNSFCTKSCAATYNNVNKTHGYRRSKLEVWLEEQLPVIYPSLEFHFNRKDAINGELDIYIPVLRLAFELNGIFHYEPIFGEEQLSKIQNNDHRKYQACIERKIELCLIDTSPLKNFKENGARKYLDIIKSLIDKKI